ncbi:MAG: SGNH/GDSL hydrolase family protein [Sedimentisphaerales bacterium]|nr:SGNH/GDSL hydrolase family protein [Sedimentisphaerales bacterium]
MDPDTKLVAGVTGKTCEVVTANNEISVGLHKRLKLKLLILLASLGLSLGIGEIALRLAGRRWAPSYPLVCKRPELYQQFEPYGYRLYPSISTYYFYPRNNPRKLSVVSNSDGFRSSREFIEIDDRLRMLVLGDSFVFGEGVEESERFTNSIEAMQPTWRIDNLGMTGYSPGLMLRALEEVGLRLNPDVVVLCIYTDDFRRVRPRYPGIGYEIPRYKLVSNRLVSVPYPKIRPWDHSRFFQGICHTYWSRTGAEFQLNRAILDRFLTLGKIYEFNLAIIFLPGTHDTKADKRRRAWLLQYTHEYEVPFLDLSETIHKAAIKQELFIPGNPHWNPEGHRVAAIEIDRFLASDVVKVRRPTESSRIENSEISLAIN